MNAICVFCGESIVDRTREHVVPQWLAEELNLSNDFILPTHFSDCGKVVSSRSHSVDQFLCGRVCGTCNHGWMSTLETANQNLIKRLIRGELDTLDLSDAEAEALAVWGAKTAYALHMASNYRRIVPVEHYRMLSQRQMVPPLVWVVGKTWHACSGFSWAQSTSWAIPRVGRELTLSEQARIRSEAYKICIQIGQLILLVAHNPLPLTQCLLWKFVHVALHPRRGAVSWLTAKPELPNDHSLSACFAFHHLFGLIAIEDTSREGDR